MTSLQKFGYASLALSLGAVQAFAATSAPATDGKTLFGETKIDAGKTGTTNDLDVSVQNLISSFLGIL